MPLVQDQLIQSNDEFRRLTLEHQQHSQRLDSLITKKYLSEDEKLEEVRLKKLKLRLKDEMERIQQQVRRDQGNVASRSLPAIEGRGRGRFQQLWRAQGQSRSHDARDLC